MRALLADVADLEGQSVTELLFDHEVPLLDQSGPEILVEDADAAACVTTELRSRARRSAAPSRAEGADPSGIGGLEISVRQVERKLFVAAATFNVGRAAVSGANDGLAAEGAGRPSYAKTRIPVAETGVVVVERAVAVASCARDHGFYGAAGKTEVHDTIVYFIERCVIFEADAEVQSQIWLELPVVLEESAENAAAKLLEGSGTAVTETATGGYACPEVCNTNLIRGGRQAVGRGCDVDVA